MTFRVLVMGLPNSGKTALSKRLSLSLSCRMFNADEVRSYFDDWDFSVSGRLRQSYRMRALCDTVYNGISIADFVCPTDNLRRVFDASYTIWMDTKKSSGYDDTDALFERPSDFNVRIRDFKEIDVDAIKKDILSKNN